VYANTNVTSRVGPEAFSEATLSIATGRCITRLSTLSRGIRGVQTAVNAVGFLQVPVHELWGLPPAERNLRVSNLRVNACQLGIIKPTDIQLYIRVSDTTVTNPQFPIATTGAGFLVEGSGIAGYRSFPFEAKPIVQQWTSQWAAKGRSVNSTCKVLW
jgi:hypothetical protein